MTRNRHCSNCRFWQSSNQESGECHRYPPTVFVGFDIESYFPVTLSVDWCGEHRQHRDHDHDDD